MWSERSKYNWCGCIVSFNYIKGIEMYELVYIGIDGKRHTMSGESFQDVTEKAMGWEVMTETENTIRNMGYKHDE